MAKQGSLLGEIPRADPGVNWQAKKDSLKLMMAALLGGTAVGGTVAGISGLRKLTKQPEPPSVPGESEFHIPYPQKQAADEGVPVLGKDWWGGAGANNPMDLWWTIPGVAAAGYAGLKGSSSLIHNMLKKKRQQMLDENLQKAQQDFHGSLLNQYKPETTHELKTASTDSLDNLYATIEKNADGGFGSSAGKTLNPDYLAPTAVGGALTLGTVLAALAARGSYRAAEGQTQEDLLGKALKQKAYLNSLRSPQPISFEAKPTPVAPQEEKVTE